MDDNISGRQAGAWGFCALTVPAVLTCAKRGWSWVLLGCAAAAVYFYVTGLLAGRTGVVRLTELTQQAFGRTGGKIALVLGSAFCLISAAQTAASAKLAFPDETSALAGPAVLMLAALAGKKGPQQAARVFGVTALILAGLYGITLLSAAKQAEPVWLRPWGSARQAAEVVPAVLSLSCLRYLPRRTGRAGGGWTALLLLGPAALAAVTAGCLSPQLTQQLAQPFYAVSQSLSVLNVMERFEPLVSAALLMGFFAFTSLLLEAAKAQLEGAFAELRGKQAVSWILAAGAFLLGLAAAGIGEEWWALGAAIFWGIIPLLTQLIVAIK